MDVAKRFWRAAGVERKARRANGQGTSASACDKGAPAASPDGLHRTLQVVVPLMCCAAAPRPPRWAPPQIDARLAPAEDSLRQLLADEGPGGYDFAFIDADKRAYGKYFELCLQLVRQGGLIAVDNVLWYGKVADSQVRFATGCLGSAGGLGRRAGQEGRAGGLLGSGRRADAAPPWVTLERMQCAVGAAAGGGCGTAGSQQAGRGVGRGWRAPAWAQGV
jgi:hypothetical protein